MTTPGIVTETLQNADAVKFTGQFYDDGSGNLRPVQELSASDLAQLASASGQTAIASALALLATHADEVAGNASLAAIQTALGQLATHTDAQTQTSALAALSTAMGALATHADAQAANTALSAIVSALQGTLTVSNTQEHTDDVAIEATLGSLATHQDEVSANALLSTIATNTGGAAATGIAQPTGGTGPLGFLSGIYRALINTLFIAPSAVPYVEGPITLTGNWQLLAAASSTRRGWSVADYLALGGIFWTANSALAGTATAGGTPVPKGGAYENPIGTPPSNAIYIIGPAGGTVTGVTY